MLEEPVSGKLDRLVPPLGGPVDTGDQRRSMNTLQVAVDERVAGFRPVCGAIRQPEVPVGVLLPGVRLEERVLVIGGRRDLAPVAVEDVLVGVDELPRPGDGSPVELVRSHAGSMRAAVDRPKSNGAGSHFQFCRLSEFGLRFRPIEATRKWFSAAFDFGRPRLTGRSVRSRDKGAMRPIGRCHVIVAGRNGFARCARPISGYIRST
jgi:hypothetical protein